MNELNVNGVSLSELARKYQISSVVLYKWRKKKNKEITTSLPKYQCIVSELEKTKQENEHLKKALGRMSEAFVATIKRDYVYTSDCKDVHVMKLFKNWIRDYNNVAPHSGLGIEKSYRI